MAGEYSTKVLTRYFDIQVRQWSGVAVHAIFVHDILLTLADEYRYVWKANWNIGKILYILVRYPFGLVYMLLSLHLYVTPHRSLTLKFCRGITHWQILGASMNIMVVQVIIGLRTVALYSFQRGIVILVACMGLISSITVLVIDILFLRQFKLEMSLVDPRFDAGCVVSCPACIPRRKYMFFLLSFFDLVLLSLTLFKYRQQAKRELNYKAYLLSVFYRDGFVYFAVILATMFTNLMIYLLARPSLVGVLFPFMRSIGGIMCARLLLNLRGAILKTTINDSPTLVAPSHMTDNAHSVVSANLGVWDISSQTYPPSQQHTSHHSRLDTGSEQNSLPQA